MCVLKAQQTCWIHFLPHKTFALYFKPASFTTMHNSQATSCLFLCLFAVIITTISPPSVNQMNSIGKNALYIASFECSCELHVFVACLTSLSPIAPIALLWSNQITAKYPNKNCLNLLIHSAIEVKTSQVSLEYSLNILIFLWRAAQS